MGRGERGIASGLGPRLGFTVRKGYAAVIYQRRARHTCPRCETGVLKRIAVGIWRCRKCSHTFAGGAYTPFTKLGEAAKRSIAQSAR